MTTDSGPCQWPISYLECGTCDALTGLDPTTHAMVESMAVEALWRWTNRSFGLCDVVVRPCRQNCWEGVSTYWGAGGGPISGRLPWQPVIIQGSWFNLSCQRCGDKCSCTDTPSIALPGPVASITSVMIDGESLPATAYRVDNARWLVRTDGGQWPTCQNMSAAPTEDNTWQVGYQRGLPVPAGGQVAAGLLACEFAKALCNDSTCQLPKRVQTVTRQGVTVAMLDSFDDLAQGRTGIWMIDSWVASVTAPARRSTVRSVDVPVAGGFRTTTWPTT